MEEPKVWELAVVSTIVGIASLGILIGIVALICLVIKHFLGQ